MERAGRSHYVQLRVGIKEFFNFLKENNIDAYVFTAGRRDLIYYTLLEEGIKIDEDHIIGNYFIYATEADVKASEANEENIKIKVGDAIDYNRPQITSMDKDDSVILNKDNHMYDGIRDDYATASTTIILGDGEGDTSMVKNRENNNAKENIFRIGFFNMSPDEAHYAERLARFKSIYDVVLPADASLSEVAEIIKRNKTIL